MGVIQGDTRILVNGSYRVAGYPKPLTLNPHWLSAGFWSADPVTPEQKRRLQALGARI